MPGVAPQANSRQNLAKLQRAHFIDAHKELHQQERNTHQAGYHEANQTALIQEYAQATADSIQNLTTPQP